MNYFAALTVFLLAGVPVTAAQNTCTSCQATSESLLETGANAAAKCGALKTYITCLASTANDAAAGCSSPAPFKTKMKEFKAATICKATDALSDVCSCQKTYWDEGGDCLKIQTLASCFTSTTGKGCDDTSTAQDILDKANTRCGKHVTIPTPRPADGSSTTAGNSKAGARAAEASGLTTIILLSILGMFFM